MVTKTKFDYADNPAFGFEENWMCGSKPVVENSSVKKESKYAHDYLEESRNILKQRGKDYDTEDKEPSGGERSMGKTVQMFNICTGHNLTEAEGWLLLQLLKDVRQWTKPEFHEDSALDSISYSALKAEALYKEYQDK